MEQNLISHHVLEEGFDHPFTEFFMSTENKELGENIQGIVEIRTNPEMHEIGDIQTHLSDVIFCLQVGYGRKVKQGKLYCSLLFLVMKHILVHFLTKFPQIQTRELSKMLRGVCMKQYIAKGKEGKKILEDLMTKNDTEEIIQTKMLRDVAIQQYVMGGSERIKEILEKSETIGQKEIAELESLFREPVLQTLSSDGVLYLKSIGVPQKIIKGFEEIFIENESKASSILTFAIMTAVYNKEELFLCYNQSTKQLGIYEKVRLPISDTSIYLVMNMTNVVKDFFGEKKLIELRKQTKGKLLEKGKSNIFALLDFIKKLTNSLVDINPDNVELRVEGTFGLEKVDKAREFFPKGSVNAHKIYGVAKVGKFDEKFELKKYREKHNI